MLQLQKTEKGQPDYAEFLHAPNRKFTDFGKYALSESCNFCCL